MSGYFERDTQSTLTLKHGECREGAKKKKKTFSQRRKEGREDGEKQNVRSVPAGPRAQTWDLQHARQESPAVWYGHCSDKPFCGCGYWQAWAIVQHHVRCVLEMVFVRVLWFRVKVGKKCLGTSFQKQVDNNKAFIAYLMNRNLVQGISIPQDFLMYSVTGQQRPLYSSVSLWHLELLTGLSPLTHCPRPPPLISWSSLGFRSWMRMTLLNLTSEVLYWGISFFLGWLVLDRRLGRFGHCPSSLQMHFHWIWEMIWEEFASEVIMLWKEDKIRNMSSKT